MPSGVPAPQFSALVGLARRVQRGPADAVSRGAQGEYRHPGRDTRRPNRRHQRREGDLRARIIWCGTAVLVGETVHLRRRRDADRLANGAGAPSETSGTNGTRGAGQQTPAGVLANNMMRGLQAYGATTTLV